MARFVAVALSLLAGVACTALPESEPVTILELRLNTSLEWTEDVLSSFILSSVANREDVRKLLVEDSDGRIKVFGPNSTPWSERVDDVSFPILFRVIATFSETAKSVTFQELAEPFEFFDADGEHSRLAMTGEGEQGRQLCWFELGVDGWKPWQYGPCTFENATRFLTCGNGRTVMRHEDIVRLMRVLKQPGSDSAPGNASCDSAASGSARSASLEPDLGVVLVVCSPTFFAAVQEPRYAAGLATLRAARDRSLQLVVVDGSPPGVAQGLQAAAGASVRIHAERGSGGKALALRQALSEALEAFPLAEVFAFQELEKTGMLEFYKELVPGLLRTTDAARPRWDICNPSRSEASWATFPQEQLLEEKFQNRMMQLVAAEHGFPFVLDWDFGPLLLRRELVRAWVDYPGTSYDSQWGPMIQAFKSNRSLVVGSPIIDYVHPASLKAEEEGKLAHAQKRLRQLNFCVAAFQSVWEA